MNPSGVFLWEVNRHKFFYQFYDKMSYYVICSVANSRHKMLYTLIAAVLPRHRRDKVPDAFFSCGILNRTNPRSNNGKIEFC